MSKRQKHLLLAVGVVITFVITGLFDQINFFYSWEAQLHDQTLRLTQDTLPDSNIFLVLLDNASYSVFGGSKANMRHELAKLIRDLSAAGTKTIVLDLIFDELTSPEADSALSRVIDSTGTVVLCANFLETDRISDQTISPITQKYNLKIGNIERIDFRSQAALNFAIFPHEIFNKRCSYLGSIANEVDLDNNERAITLIVYYNDIFFPALGLSALLHYFGETDNSFAIRKTLLTHYFEITSSNRKISIPINRKGQVLLNYYGPIEVFDRISFLEMKNLLSAYQSEQIKPINLKNKINGNTIPKSWIRSGKLTISISISCLDPSLVSSNLVNSTYSTILMSGTLLPPQMYSDLLGFDENTSFVILPNPFPEDCSSLR